MTRIFGFELNPRNKYAKRKLQLLAVLFHVMNFTINPLGFMVMVIYMLYTRLWFVSMGYLLWCSYDYMIQKTHKKGGRPSRVVRSSNLISYFAEYFPIYLHKSAELDPQKNYLFAYHPHGVMTFGAMCNFGSDVTGFTSFFPGIQPHLVTLEMNFRVPFLRGYLLWLGICDASKESINYILSKLGRGQAVVCVVGGAAESLDARPGSFKLTLLNRKGFVKIAIQNGASLVPVFSFGENDLYSQADNSKGSFLRIFQEKFKKHLGFSPCIFYGRGILNYTFGLLPFRHPVNTVVGKPIDMPKDENPKLELLNEMHAKYMSGLNDLFDEHKVKFGIDKDKHLIFI